VKPICSALFLVGFAALPAAAQSVSPNIVPCWELDTTTASATFDPQRGAVLEVWPIWRDYLDARIHGKDQPDRWLEAERARWGEYDLTAFQAYQNLDRSTVTVLSIRPSATDVRDTLIIRTLFSRVATDSATHATAVRPFSLTRVYAVKTPRGWRLSNALPHLTAGWDRTEQGPITFIYSPSSHPDPAKRQAAAQFVDSLAFTFSLAPPRGLEYIVTSSGEEAYRVMGFDFGITGGVTAGFSSIPNHLVVSGDPRLGEAYFHELAHQVFAPMTEGIPRFLNEGLATWAGGSLGFTYPALKIEYARFLRTHPEVSLDLLVDGKVKTDAGYLPGAAILCDLIFQTGGLASLRTLVIQSRQTNFRKAVELATGHTWYQVAEKWMQWARGPTSSARSGSDKEGDGSDKGANRYPRRR